MVVISHVNANQPILERTVQRLVRRISCFRLLQLNSLGLEVVTRREDSYGFVCTLFIHKSQHAIWCTSFPFPLKQYFSHRGVRCTPFDVSLDAYFQSYTAYAIRSSIMHRNTQWKFLYSFTEQQLHCSYLFPALSLDAFMLEEKSLSLSWLTL